MNIARKRYHKASRKEKSRILDEIVKNLHIHRKSATRPVKFGYAKTTEIYTHGPADRIKRKIHNLSYHGKTLGIRQL